eukprot:gene6841-9365_t
MLGWYIEWRNSFRRLNGFIIEVQNDAYTVYETTDCDTRQVSTTTPTKKIRPAVKEFANLRRSYYNSLNDNSTSAEIHDKVLYDLSKLSDEGEMGKAKALGMKEEIRLKAIHSVSEDDMSPSSMKRSKAPAQSAKRFEGNVSSSDDSGSDNGQQDEEDDNDDEDGDEDADEDEDDEDDSNADEDNDDEDESDEEESSEDDDEKVDIKVYVLPNNDIRGFFSQINAGGLKKLTQKLSKEYNNVKPKLYFFDTENERVNIISANDFKYAYRSAKSEIKGSSPQNIKLKIYADFAGSSSVSNKSGLLNDNFNFSSITSRGNSLATTKKLLFSEDKNVHYIDSPSSKQNYDHKNEVHSNHRFPDMTLKVGVSISDNSPMVSPATKKLDYEVLWKRGEKLGAGSFGTVYSGINMTTGERMAVKEVSLTGGKRQRQQAKALQQEVKVLSSLDHPNIIKYLGTEFTKNTLRIFLELATDGTLKDALNEFGAFPEPLIRRYTNDIMCGLAFIHSKRFIHRDIKPTNLLVSNGVLKLADFGCASAVFESDNTSEADHATITGTTVYMAPEVMSAGEGLANDGYASVNKEAKQLSYDEYDDGAGDSPYETIKSAEKNPSNLDSPNHINSHLSDSKQKLKKKQSPQTPTTQKGYGKKADIWSVGITLCEMSTARSPFKSAGAAIYNVCVTKNYPTFPENFSTEAHAFLGRCLVGNPSDRANCTELRAHPFLSAQSFDQMRAQTTSALSNTYHMKASTIRQAPGDLSFLQSFPAGSNSQDYDENDETNRNNNHKNELQSVEDGFLGSPARKSNDNIERPTARVGIRGVLEEEDISDDHNHNNRRHASTIGSSKYSDATAISLTYYETARSGDDIKGMVRYNSKAGIVPMSKGADDDDEVEDQVQAVYDDNDYNTKYSSKSKNVKNKSNYDNNSENDAKMSSIPYSDSIDSDYDSIPAMTGGSTQFNSTTANNKSNKPRR